MLAIIFYAVLIFYVSLRIFVNRKSDTLSCLVGKTAIVTGGNSGLGFATSLLLASRGCKVIIADRVNAEKSRDEIIRITGNSEVTYKYLDLSSFKIVRQFVEDIRQVEEKIDILINNAGTTTASCQISEDGLNSIMQINYFGAFLLTHLLLDQLKASGSARIIFLGSVSMYTHGLNVDNLNLADYDDKTSIRTIYGNSKLCNVLAAQEFNRKLEKYGITANSVDPGAVRTEIIRKTQEFYNSLDVVIPFFLVLSIFGQDPLSGSQTIFDVATNTKYNNKGGGHYGYLCRWFKPSILRNQKFCDDVWMETEKLIKLKEEEKI